MNKTEVENAKKLYAIKIRPDDTFERVEYKDYTTISQIVDGTFDTVTVQPIDAGPFGKVKAIFFCNDEGLLRDTCMDNKVNAIVTGLYGYPIYGDVCMLKDTVNEYGERDSIGFNETELTFNAEPYIRYLKGENKDIIQDIHEHFDGKKPEPKMEFYTMTDEEFDELEK